MSAPRTVTWGLDRRGRIVPVSGRAEGPFTRARKECSLCRAVKPDLDFSLDLHRSDGLCHVCKDCQRACREGRPAFERDDVERETTGSAAWLGGPRTGGSR